VNAATTFVPLTVGPFWADLNEHLCQLVALVPEDRLDDAPEGEWGVRDVARHIVAARDHWMANAVHDGAPLERRPSTGSTELQEALRASWERIAAFVSSADALAAQYQPPPNDPEYVDPPAYTGHYIAFHRLAHDVHHRAQLLDRLRALGIEVPASIRRRPL
jgi:uncharacterized damage-inducible protein DinB